VTHPRRFVGGLALLVVALVSAGCNGLVRPQGWATPALDGSTAYVFLDKDRISAVDLGGSGAPQVRWTFPDDGNAGQDEIEIEAAYGSPTVLDDTLYFVGHEGDVFALDTESGLPSWQFDAVEGSVVDGPAIGDDRLAFGTTEGRLYVLNLDGSVAEGWDGGRNLGEPIWATPVIDDGRLFVATMDGSLHGFNLADGSELWEPFEANAAIPSLAILGGTLFVPSFDKHVYLVDPATGQARFEDAFATGHWVWTSPAFQDGVAYFGDLDGKVYALDITRNQAVWSAPYQADAKVKSGPIIDGDTLVVVDHEPVAHFLALADGSLRGAFPLPTGDTVRADLVADGEHILAITTKGDLFELDPETRTAAQVTVAGGS